MWAPDYPWGRTEGEYEREVQRELRIFGPREQAQPGEVLVSSTVRDLVAGSGLNWGAPYSPGDGHIERPET
jgi:hypothetical protein